MRAFVAPFLTVYALLKFVRTFSEKLENNICTATVPIPVGQYWRPSNKAPAVLKSLVHNSNCRCTNSRFLIPKNPLRYINKTEQYMRLLNGLFCCFLKGKIFSNPSRHFKLPSSGTVCHPLFIVHSPAYIFMFISHFGLRSQNQT